MFLNREQERMLKGDHGSAVQKAMELLVAIGDALNAEKLIPISSAHISGVSYTSIGDAGLLFLKDFALLGAKVKVSTSLNPAGIDLDRWRQMGVKEDFYEKQRQILDAFYKMGVKLTCTCTPYFSGNLPRSNSDIAWAESSAVVYANSVLKAKTNRESGPSALASAITGYIPLCGYHLEENRRGSHNIILEFKPKSLLDASIIGFIAGKKVVSGVPVFPKSKNFTSDHLKAMSAGLATSGGISMFRIRDASEELNVKEKVFIEPSDVNEVLDRYSASTQVNTIFFGCPHCSLSELKNLASLLKGRRVKGDIRLWVFTSRAVYSQAEKAGLIDLIEHAGGRVYCDTCPIVMPLYLLHGHTIATNSSKAAYYLTTLHGIEVSLLDVNSCIKLYTEGV